MPYQAKLNPVEELEKAIREGKDKEVWFSWDIDSKKLKFYHGLELEADFESLTKFGETVKELVRKHYGELKYVRGTFNTELYVADGIELYLSANFGYLYVEVSPYGSHG